MSQFHRLAIPLLAVAVAWSCVESVEIGSLSTGFRFDFPSESPSGKFVPFLASRNGAFAAGLIKNGEAVKLVIVGIDNNQVNSPLDTIWVANRDLPVQAASSVLFDGSLTIVKNPGKDVLWSSTVKGGADVLELMDSGNLVMRSAATVLWQSFDYPTDTLLQGQNFTRDMKLVSWISSTDSSSGHYSLQLGIDRLLLYVNFGTDQSSVGEPYWVNAALQEPEELQASKGPMYMRIGDGFMGMYQSETQRVHFVPFSSSSLNSSVPRIRRGRVNSDGNFQVYYWNNGTMVEDYKALDGSNPCESPVACGSYGLCSSSGSTKVCKCPGASEESRNSTFVARNSSDLSQGCVPKHLPSLCSSSAFSDEFLELQEVDYFANDITGPLNGSSSSLEQCRSSCLRNCSCKAFFFRNDSGSCFLTDQMLTLLASPNTRDTAYIRVANPLELSRRRSSSSAKKRSVDIALLVLAVVLGAGAGLYFILRRRKGHSSWNSDEEAFLEHSRHLNKFSYSELESATNGFVDSSKFHFIKVLGLSTRAFKRGLTLLQRLSEQHQTIARLAGYCIHGDEHFLVYQRLAGGTLADQLRQEQDWGRQLLDWNTKLRIGLEVARGLALLHAKGLGLRDRGLVTRNILLDEHYEPKLSGYLVEDWDGLFSDVQCLGTVLLELVGGATHENEGDKDSPYERNRKLLIDAANHCSTAEQGTTAETAVAILEDRKTSDFSFRVG